MDRVTLSLIENLAFADIMITLLFYLPMFSTLVAGGWVFGSRLCWFLGFFGAHVPFMAEILIITTISCYRLWMMKKPPGQRSIVNLTHVKLCMMAVWLLSTVPILYWITVKVSAFYLSSSLICWTSNHIPSSSTYTSTKVFTVIFIAAPILTVFLANVKLVHTLIMHTLRARKPLYPHLRTVVTVTLICWALLVSYLPIIVVIVLKSTGTAIPNWFILFQVYAKGFHVVLNPFIYVATNQRFRSHVARGLRLRSLNGFGRPSRESQYETPINALIHS